MCSYSFFTGPFCQIHLQIKKQTPHWSAKNLADQEALEESQNLLDRGSKTPRDDEGARKPDLFGEIHQNSNRRAENGD